MIYCITPDNNTGSHIKFNDDLSLNSIEISYFEGSTYIKDKEDFQEIFDANLKYDALMWFIYNLYFVEEGKCCSRAIPLDDRRVIDSMNFLGKEQDDK